MNQKKGFLALLAATITISSSGVLIRLLSQAFGDFTQVAFRFAIAAVLIIAWAKITRTKLHLPQVNKVALNLFIIGFPLVVVSFTKSVTTIKATNAVFYLFTASIISSLIIGSFYFKEKLTPSKLISLILAIIGLLVFSHPINVSLASSGALYAVLAGSTYAITNTVRKLLGALNPHALLVYQYGIGAILLSSAAILSGEVIIKNFTLPALFVGIIFGIILVIVGWFSLYGFNNFDLNLGTIILSSEIFFAALINVAILSEIPTGNEIIGGLIIVAAILVINLTTQSTKNPT